MALDLSLTWTIGLIVSAAFLLFMLPLWPGARPCGSAGGHRSRRLMPFDRLATGTALALLVLYLTFDLANGRPVIDALLLSGFHTIRVFLANEEVALSRDAAILALPGAARWIGFYAGLLHLLAPVLLLGVVLSRLAGLMSGLRLRLSGRRHLYVFDHIDERTLRLGEDLAAEGRREKRRQRIIYCNRTAWDADRQSEHHERIVAIDAILLSAAIDTVRLPRLRGGAQAHLFIMGADESTNIHLGLALADRLQSRPEITIHAEHAQPEGEALCDAANVQAVAASGKGVLRRIDLYRSVIRQLFETHPPCLAANGTRLKAIVVGAGRLGLETVRTLSWCGQGEDRKPEIVVFDRDPLVPARAAHLFPELIGVGEGDADASVTIRFVEGDAETDSLDRMIGENRDAQLVVVALGDDAANLRTAQTIRACFLRMHARETDQSALAKRGMLPLIHVHLASPVSADLALRLRSPQGTTLDLHPFGTSRNLTAEALFDRRADRLARAVHAAYGATVKSYESYEYNRRSSMAFALHLQEKMNLLLPLPAADPQTGERPDPFTPERIDAFAAMLDDDAVERLARLEHERWNAFMRAEGFTRSDAVEMIRWQEAFGRHDNTLARRHPCIVSWDELDPLSATLTDAKGEPVDFKKTDRDIIRKIPTILRTLHVS